MLLRRRIWLGYLAPGRRELRELHGDVSSRAIMALFDNPTVLTANAMTSGDSRDGWYHVVWWVGRRNIKLQDLLADDMFLVSPSWTLKAG